FHPFAVHFLIYLYRKGAAKQASYTKEIQSFFKVLVSLVTNQTNPASILSLHIALYAFLQHLCRLKLFDFEELQKISQTLQDYFNLSLVPPYSFEKNQNSPFFENPIEPSLFGLFSRIPSLSYKAPYSLQKYLEETRFHHYYLPPEMPFFRFLTDPIKNKNDLLQMVSHMTYVSWIEYLLLNPRESYEKKAHLLYQGLSLLGNQILDIQTNSNIEVRLIPFLVYLKLLRLAEKDGVLDYEKSWHFFKKFLARFQNRLPKQRSFLIFFLFLFLQDLQILTKREGEKEFQKEKERFLRLPMERKWEFYFMAARVLMAQQNHWEGTTSLGLQIFHHISKNEDFNLFHWREMACQQKRSLELYQYLSPMGGKIHIPVPDPSLKEEFIEFCRKNQISFQSYSWCCANEDFIEIHLDPSHSPLILRKWLVSFVQLPLIKSIFTLERSPSQSPYFPLQFTLEGEKRFWEYQSLKEEVKLFALALMVISPYPFFFDMFSDSIIESFSPIRAGGGNVFDMNLGELRRGLPQNRADLLGIAFITREDMESLVLEKSTPPFEEILMIYHLLGSAITTYFEVEAAESHLPMALQKEICQIVNELLSYLLDIFVKNGWDKAFLTRIFVEENKDTEKKLLEKLGLFKSHKSRRFQGKDLAYEIRFFLDSMVDQIIMAHLKEYGRSLAPLSPEERATYLKEALACAGFMDHAFLQKDSHLDNSKDIEDLQSYTKEEKEKRAWEKLRSLYCK
ncbi:MAG: hypothetical protein D6785_00830, partial [Planctomycetota bacterium]